MHHCAGAGLGAEDADRDDDVMLKAGWFTPMLHVGSIERSIEFYERLGFELIDTDHCVPIGWARMHCEGGAVMFLRGEEPAERRESAVLFYMYTADLPGLRAQLLTSGVDVPEICFPDYGPSGEVHLRDPDDYFIGIAHWGEKEHTEWLQRIGRNSV
jgi:catechol 2,3-dioxygenase-like lactoylglutathione lyase family enzyme